MNSKREKVLLELVLYWVYIKKISITKRFNSSDLRFLFKKQ